MFVTRQTIAIAASPRQAIQVLFLSDAILHPVVCCAAYFISCHHSE
jgi:hypothetical protein